MDLFEARFGIKFPPISSSYPNEWSYEKKFATSEQIKEIWRMIENDYNYSFWRNLAPYDGAREFLAQAQNKFDKIVFITSRGGDSCQLATEDSLKYLGVEKPQVIISHHKVPDIIKFNVTDFLDDRDKNFEDILLARWDMPQLDKVNLFMHNRPWNLYYEHPNVKRILKPSEIWA